MFCSLCSYVDQSTVKEYSDDANIILSSSLVIALSFILKNLIFCRCKSMPLPQYWRLTGVDQNGIISYGNYDICV